MRFAFSEEQEELRRGARRFLEAHSSPARVRQAMASERGFDDEVWRRIGESLGWPSLIIPEEYGGSGFGAVELCAVMEEMGRALLCAPFFSSVCLAANVLLAGGSEAQKREHLPAIAAGTRLATLALVEPGGRWDAEGVEAVARGEGDEYRLDGVKSFVLDGHVANWVIAAARHAGSSGPEGVSLFLVPGASAGLERRCLPTMDQTRRQAELRLHGVRVPRDALVGEEGGGWSIVRRVLDRAAAALAAEQVGGAERCLEMAVDYAKTRVQFGRPIGSFQAIKHKCADLFLAVESARSAAYYAAWASTAAEEELPAAASLAKAYCSDAYFQCAAENIQIHGGIGFTWEHDAHLHFKRARSSEILLGDPVHHREQYARRIGL